ncbi:peptidase C45 [Virgibacillus sp. NKC19-3]|uniref:C45 family autoproteolytic acyltransferase/hydolase n=1 Tax=Virgibacillus saliphilus TaxID=2831674 RepID=UPI001C9B2654|nr:C45 family peptidase [Virgibacillus sp. NKC19-3]MBY7143941.1 peptidase C45 [Virgibacillus sp. NKC19-3]
MKDFQISIEQYRGSSYDIGYQQGKQVDQSLINMYSNIVDVDGINLDELKDLYHLYAPHLLEELSGLADSMDISFNKAALFSGYGTPEIQGMGCSSVVNDKMLVRNYDFSPELYDSRLVFVQPKEGYASVGHSLHMLGRTEGANENGLAVALHFINDKDTQKGLTAGSVIRIVLDTCKNTDEAITMIRQLPHSWSYNFSIGDAEGHTVVVEESPFDIKVRRDNDILFCTNHFQKQEMNNLNRENLEGTQGRLDYLSQSNLRKLNGQEAFNRFRDATTPLYNEAYDAFFGTMHTFAYLFEEDKILTAIPGGEVLEIDFTEWVKGKNVRQHALNGYLNYS